MNPILEKWLYYNGDMLMRHVGTAGMTTLGVLYVGGKWNWKAFGVGLLIGAVLPTIFTIFQRGLPKLWPEQNNENPPNDGSSGTPAAGGK